MRVRTGKVLIGQAGRATEILPDLTESDPKDWNASLAGYFLQCPGQSPAWDKYGITLIHLRPVEGVKPAHIRREGATHEIMLLAYDPRKHPKAEDPSSWQHMSPLNLEHQCVFPSDEAALEAFRSLVQGVCDGILWAEPPLSGQTEPWASHIKLLEDHAQGLHDGISH